MPAETDSKSSVCTVPSCAPAWIPHFLKRTGAALILLAAVFQFIQWARYYGPFIPLVLPSGPSMTCSVISAAGLALVLQASGANLCRAAACLVPHVGPFLGFAALLRPSILGPSRPTFLHSPGSMRVLDRVLCWLLGLLGLAVLGLTLVLQQAQVSKPSPNGSARVFVHGRMHAAIRVQETWGIFLTSNRLILDAGDYAQVKRIVWSKDGSRVLLIGADSDSGGSRRFGPRDATDRLDALFVMYDLSSGDLWFNSVHRKEYPAFGFEDIRQIEWEVPVFEERQSTVGSKADTSGVLRDA